MNNQSQMKNSEQPNQSKVNSFILPKQSEPKIKLELNDTSNYNHVTIKIDQLN